MTSAINPNNIDGAFPVAGRDNDSQGFRDNFTNTKNNFAYAKEEIENLQKNVILKSPITGVPFNNDMNGQILSNVRFQNTSQVRVALGNVSGNVAVDYRSGMCYTMSLTGPVSLLLSNWASAGNLCQLRLEITISDIAHTVEFPSSVSGTSTNYIAGWNSGTVTFAAPGTYVFELSTNDAGATVSIQDVTRNSNYYGSDELIDAAEVNLATSVTYFSTSAVETGILAAGRDGQIKTFAMYSTLGDMVITVSNAGWKETGTGTITFSAIGQSCTLQYINNKWFCIGNNGATFA
jgi:hypothetical protein